MDVFGELDLKIVSTRSGMIVMSHALVSPASPENARMQWSFNVRVLSSEALRTVAPRIAAFEAAMIVKSLPVIPSRTSLHVISTMILSCCS